MNFLLMDADIEEGKKEEILKQLKLLTLFTSQREAILGKKRPFLKGKLELGEVFEMLELLIEDEAKKRGVELTFVKTNLLIEADREVIMNGLEHILLRLMEGSKKITVGINDKKHTLTIKYDSNELLKLTKNKLIDFLKKGPEYADVFFQISVYLMNMSGIKTKFKKGVAEVVLKRA